jgi:hypothetical protein
MTNLKEYAQDLDMGIFSSRETLSEALDYAYAIAKATEDPAAVITAVHVVLNTVSRELKQIESCYN